MIHVPRQANTKPATQKGRNKPLEEIGNIVHDSVLFSDDDANNAVIRSWGEKQLQEPTIKNHVELVKLAEIAEFARGAEVAGSRGFYLDPTIFFPPGRDINSHPMYYFNA
ncbi:Seryl-tRNA synthetase / serine--tRNA ligase isoform 2 [Prunus yedoensis var. nudiflora]|uniref:Seryl-tRNA synthetase / serine--tRNA ligase isoform 2 n=1 Tax=Prunus yedoensis var. nudiflora TaxID=2094558 RepID=A0A314UYQ1_PRUYE|nr:Seryl-tRNA synthetase / serine--tRNA ligase isoform 2 [Prunus yedoensis var. nudiflora]